MKKTIFIIISLTLLGFLLVSCSTHDTSVTSNPSNDSKDNNPNISIQSSMTLSNNDLFPLNGKQQYLRVKMIEGKYYEDWNSGAFMGTIWNGSFIIELNDDSGNVMTKTDLSTVYEEPLIFNSAFEIAFDDYNNDEDLDFTIGQYSSSNGNNYKLFTLRSDGKVEELPIKDYHSLFISKTEGFYSTKLTKVDKNSFHIQYYDNSKQKNFIDTFRWNGKEFVRVKQVNN